MLEKNTDYKLPTLNLNIKVGPSLQLAHDSNNTLQYATSTLVAISLFGLIGLVSASIFIPISQGLIQTPWADELRSNIQATSGLRLEPEHDSSQPSLQDASVISENFLTIKIGHVAPTSGVIAHLGKDNEYGARMAIEELNLSGLKIGPKTVKFELLTKDDAADPSQGIAVAQQLVNSRVNGIIGHLNSGTTIPASQIYNIAGIPQITPSATNPKYTRQGYQGAFRLIADDSQLGEAMGKLAVQNLKSTRIAVMDDRTAYGAGIAEAFKRGVTIAGGNIVAHEFTSDKSSEFYAQLNSIKTKKPDIIFYGGMDSVAAHILRQMNSLGIQAKLLGGDGICTSELARLAGDIMLDDWVLCAESGGVEDSRKAAMDKFRSVFKEKYNSDVQVYAPYVYDAVKVMASAMVAAGSGDPAIYLPVLKSINYKGITGDITFDNKGDIQNPAFTIFTYRRGERIELAVIR